MTSMTVLARSTSAHSSSPANFSNKGGYSDVSSPQWNQGPTGKRSHPFTKKVPKAKQSGKWNSSQTSYKRPKNHSPKHNDLLHRLTPQSPPGTLLQRIGLESPSRDRANLADRIDLDQMVDLEEGVDLYTDLPDDSIPHFYTPEPGEVERFLESVIGSPPPPPPGTSCSFKPTKPTLALETHNLPLVNRRIKVEEDFTTSVLYSPTTTAVNSLPSISAYPLDQSTPLLNDMTPPSAAALEECRKLLIPILLSAAKARDTAKDLDAEQCLRLLSDDQCTLFLRQSKEMRRQLSSRISETTPVNQEGWSGSQKYSSSSARVGEKDAWNQGGTRSRFSSMNTVVSDAGVLRRDSEITLVDFPEGKSPPKAPRAMIQGYAKYNNWKDDHPEHSNSLVTSPISEEPPNSASSLIDLVREAIRMFPALVPAAASMIETQMDVDTSETRAPMGQSTGLPPAPASVPKHEDFVSHLPTQPGLWFSQQGKRHAEVVDIEIEVSEEMFFISKVSRLSRTQMNVSLCSVPVGGMTNGATKEDVNAFIHRDSMHWPRKGTLVVQVNPDSEQGKTWLPYLLDSIPLDVSSCMIPGKNHFRFIQLSDLSDFAFVLVASPHSPEEEWRSLDWSSVFDRSRMEPRLEDDPPNSLSEFAHVPVIVRS